jgi:DNA-binding NarL/FixJ family response regulator
MPVDLLLIEDDPLTVERLCALLALDPDVRLAAIVSTLHDALEWLGRHSADVVLVDLGLPDGSGLDAIRFAAARYPRCDILVISVFGDADHVVAAVEAGATGYLLKDGSLEHLGEHLAHLRLGGSPLSPRIARLLIRRQAGLAATPACGWRNEVASRPTRAPAAGCAPLSVRELDVLTGIAKGFSYGEVAQALGISPNTVRTHVRRIYEKLAVNSGAEAVYEYNQWQAARGRPPLR